MMDDKANRLLIVLAIVVIAFIIISDRKKKKESGYSSDDFKKNTIKTLVRQASRWSVAAAQDESPMVAVLHANYGAGYLWALKDIATDKEIEETTGINMIKFRDEITRVQDNATRRMIKLCPKYAPKQSYLLGLIG